jgi:hypothetical protein
MRHYFECVWWDFESLPTNLSTVSVDINNQFADLMKDNALVRHDPIKLNFVKD